MTAEAFIEGFSPRNFVYMAMDEDRCHIGKGPTLDHARQIYGIQALTTLVEIYLKDLAKFCSCRLMVNQDQLTDLICIIVTQHKHMRVAELGLFFIKYKAGNYGKVYRELYAMDITTALLEWHTTCIQRQNELLHEQFQRTLLHHNDEHFILMYE